ncbi:MAG: alpha/beta hydrolase [Pararhodobacter sp.]
MRWLIALAALAVIALSVWQLEGDRAGLTIAPLDTRGGPPATLYLRTEGGPAPAVVIVHGFAGSRQLMAPFALTLARAGYTVASLDLMGHGRNPAPITGDLTRIEGTTMLMVAEMQAVAQAALAHPRADGRLAWLGHSMASDLVLRAGLQAPEAGAVVAISAFSQAVTAEAPANILIINGALETRLRDEARRVIALTDPEAGEGQTVGDRASGTARRAVAAPGVEHVGVLYSGTALREARDWLDAAFERESTAPPALRGGWIMLLLAGIVALGWPLARTLPAERAPCPAPLPARRFLVVALAPALLVPLALWPVETRVLPVLVADYLALHFALYGVLSLALLGWWGQLRGQFPARIWWIAAAVAGFGILVFGGALDRYVASFFPHAGRAAVIAGLALGALPFMLGDALLTQGGRARVWRVVLARGAFLVSLMIAVALDFEGLFFLVIILPVILLFFLLFGLMAGWVGRQTGLPAAAGLGLGLVLAWSLGVTFPMVAV